MPTAPVLTGSTPKSSVDIGKLLADLGRTQLAYEEYTSAGRQDLAEQAVKYSQSLRSQAQAAGIDLNQYGTFDQSKGKQMYTQYYKGTGYAGSYDPSQPGLTVRGTGNSTTKQGQFVAYGDTPSNPYDSQVAEILKRLTQNLDNPATNPYDQQISDLITQIQGLVNQGPVDPYSSPEYAAAQAQTQRAAEQGIRSAQESLGESGFARSTVVSDRAQSIQNDANEYLQTQLVPSIINVLQGRKQAEIQNMGAVLEMMTGQQGLFDSRNQNQLQNMAGLVGLLQGQQGLFDDRAQNEFQNEMSLEELNLGKQEFALREEMSKIETALARAETLGYVDGAGAAILGVPAGTETWRAKEAVAQRKHQLDMQANEIAAQKAIAAASRSQSSAGDNIRHLLSVWEMTGEAPPGLEGLGVKPGTPISNSMNPNQALAQLELDEKTAAIEADKKMNEAIPGIQSKYGVSKDTAGAIYSVFDNPTYDAAMADLKAHEGQLRQMGVDVNAVKRAISENYGAPSKKKDGKNVKDIIETPASMGWMNYLMPPGILK